MENKFGHKFAKRPLSIQKLIKSISNKDKRNLLRGYISKEHLTTNEIENIRRGNIPSDNLKIGALLKGPNGFISHEGKKRTCDELFIMTAFQSLDWKSEICYSAGYINSMLSKTSEILNDIFRLTNIDSQETNEALSIILDISKKYGSSNFVSFKLAYIKSSRHLQTNALTIISQIEDEIGHKENVGFHFSALENISSKITLFVVAQRRISALVGRVDGQFRKAVSLSNFVPTPLDEDDISGFLLRSTESCLIDTIYAILIIFNLKEEFPAVHDEFKIRLDDRIYKEIQNFLNYSSSLEVESLPTEQYIEESVLSDKSLNLYRLSSAFLERKKFTKYRNKFDRVIGARLLEEIIDGKVYIISQPYNDKNKLLSPNDSPLNEEFPIGLDSFYRTFLFLRYINLRSNILSFNKDEIKFVFENTVGLEMLLTEDEIRALYLTCPPETKSLVAVLALALFKEKSIDPDVDFEFRTDFISHVNKIHSGSIVEFINHLLKDSPHVASYIVGTLDEVTLEKMYTIVKNSSQASEIRYEILRAVGQKLNKIEYFVEADEITTRSKVSKLMQYFDSSRMYVDSISMKKWLDSNPTASTEQYRTLYSRIEARIKSIDNPDGKESSALVIYVNDQDEYLVSQIAKEAFEQFCLNTEFGIESYLGRRIRHNTLDGVTTDTVDAVFRKPEYRPVIANANMRRTVEAWTQTYKSIIDKLRRDHLQFKPSGSLFKSALDLKDPITKENIRKLSSTLKSAGRSELLNDLVIAFCWKQITPQLENAARFIKTTLLREANNSIDKYFSGHHGVVEDQIKSDLHDAVNEVFKKVSDWFQVPQTGFISASVRDLCQIILIELHRDGSTVNYSGAAVDIKYTGISVHRLYDCLAVILQNANKHGEINSQIEIEVNSNIADDESTLEILSVFITSTVSEDNYKSAKERILTAIGSEEAGIDMVTEGYTGIKKIKFITRQCEGEHTISCDHDDAKRMLKIGFVLHTETATDDKK